MRRIVQQTGTSCGVAGVAMLARLSYRDGFRTGIALWSKEYWDGSHRTDSDELRKMLAVLGRRLCWMVKCRTWPKVPPGVVLAVQVKLPKNEWRWVVSGEGSAGAYFLDPRRSVKTIQRRDFKNARPSWYHRVTAL